MKTLLRGLAIVTMAVLIAGCGDDSSPEAARQQTTTTPGSGTTTRATSLEESYGGPTVPPTSSVPGTSGPGTTAGGGGTGPATTVGSTASGPAPTNPPQGSTGISFAELLRTREALIGQAVTVEGRVLFLMSCPPDGGSGSCSASGYLAGKDTLDLPTNVTRAQEQAMLLWEGSGAVGCSGVSSLANFECRGYRHQGQYRVTGVVNRLVAAGGSPTNIILLDVKSKDSL